MTPPRFGRTLFMDSDATPTETSISTGLASQLSGINFQARRRTGSDDGVSSGNSSNNNGDVSDNEDGGYDDNEEGGNGDGADSDGASSEKSTTPEHKTNTDKKKREDPHGDDGNESADIPQRPRCIIPSKLEVKMIRTQSGQQKVTAWLMDQVDTSM
ncbi:hypothetical protein CC80DRAFT_546608 [Byssothecium circinans]|uniref:Uncharacterized protein n=1 Tax=Byssothecium circinans TaxID=147558 RepID=A0A6A5U183_9PLEO|nr:hypothetical protein CC80DRAFT_546608 [Byssothecium circinans]